MFRLGDVEGEMFWWNWRGNGGGGGKGGKLLGRTDKTGDNEVTTFYEGIKLRVFGGIQRRNTS